MSVVVTARFHPLAEHRSALIEALRASIPAVHQQPGCLLYALHDASDGSLTMIEKWASGTDLLAHASRPAAAALDAATAAFLAQPIVVTTMTAIPAGTTGQGLL